MDVERTIEFILQMQAKAETRMDRAEARMDRQEARADKFDKRLDKIAKLVGHAMDMKVADRQETRELKRSLRELSIKVEDVAEEVKKLAAAQVITERKFQTFLNTFGKAGNGHKS